jgi:hypothetical protein
MARISQARANICSVSRNRLLFLLVDRCVEGIAFCQRAWCVFAVAFDFRFLVIVCVGAIVAAIGFQTRNLTFAQFVRAFVLATSIENFCHNPPQFLICLANSSKINLSLGSQ